MVTGDTRSLRRELSAAELALVFRQLSKGGVRTVMLMGGEPTVRRDDLHGLLHLAADLGLKVSLSTNLIDVEACADLVPESALSAIVVSLDGASAQTHDWLRGSGAFDATVRNVRALSRIGRVSNGEVGIELAFVVTRRNAYEAGTVVTLAGELRAKLLHIIDLVLAGRAMTHQLQLVPTYRAILRAYSQVVVTWAVTQKTELEIHVPPALACYMQHRYSYPYPVDGRPACGGTDVFGYVDLAGNLLACPRLAYEADPECTQAGPRIGASLLEHDVAEVLDSPEIADFEQRRAGKSRLDKVFPCKFCRFRDMCTPCLVPSTFNGRRGPEERLCAAVLLHGDEEVPGLSEYVFPKWKRRV
jgi:MoaA/NifB/PqqE/SkfB family radical SAM enzyme